MSELKVKKMNRLPKKFTINGKKNLSKVKILCLMQYRERKLWWVNGTPLEQLAEEGEKLLGVPKSYTTSVMGRFCRRKAGKDDALGYGYCRAKAEFVEPGVTSAHPRKLFTHAVIRLDDGGRLLLHKVPLEIRNKIYSDIADAEKRVFTPAQLMWRKNTNLIMSRLKRQPKRPEPIKQLEPFPFWQRIEEQRRLERMQQRSLSMFEDGYGDE